MARKSQHTFSKRQREQKKAEKAAQKQSRREERKHGLPAETSEDDAPADEADAAEGS